MAVLCYFAPELFPHTRCALQDNTYQDTTDSRISDILVPCRATRVLWPCLHVYLLLDFQNHLLICVCK